MKLLSVSQFCELANTTKRTLQYYDNMGIFMPASKDEKNNRLYLKSQIINFTIIQTLTNCKIPLNQIKNDLYFYDNSFPRTYSKHRKKVLEYLNQIEQNINKIDHYFSIYNPISKQINKLVQTSIIIPESYTLQVHAKIDKLSSIIKAFSSQFSYFPKNPTLYISIDLSQQLNTLFNISVKKEGKIIPKQPTSGIFLSPEHTAKTYSRTYLVSEQHIYKKLELWHLRARNNFSNLLSIIHTQSNSKNYLQEIHLS